MFYFLSKAFTFLLMPYTWALILLTLGLFLKRPNLKKWSLRAALILLYICSNQFVVNGLLNAWEYPPMPISQIEQPYDVAILLSGITHPLKEPKDRVYIKVNPDRIMHTAMIYQKGLVKKVLVTGTYAVPNGPVFDEATDIKTVLMLAGVKESDIILETKAKNTRENAVFSAKILKEQFPNQRYLVVTSAFHCRRAKACFDKVGIEVEMFGTDFLGRDSLYGFGSYIIPSEESLYRLSTVIKELTGYVIYRIQGYI